MFLIIPSIAKVTTLTEVEAKDRIIITHGILNFKTWSPIPLNKLARSVVYRTRLGPPLGEKGEVVKARA